MRILAADRPESLAEAARLLREGGLVAFPTETVYGLCVRADHPAAVERLYSLKGRDPERACALLLPDRAAAEEAVGEFPPIARRIADRFWPGPVTLVLPGPDGETVGLRVPGHDAARALATEAGVPLLQSSANPSGEPPALDAERVRRTFGERVDLLLDGGPAPGGKSSTVVRCADGAFEVLREGAVPAKEVARAASRLILIACTGNLCRSPLAEALLRRALCEACGCEPRWLLHHGFRVASFGTMTVRGRPATDEMIEVAREEGLDLTRHRSREFSIGIVKAADRIYALARNHLDFLDAYFADRPDDLALLDPDGKEIADPYGRSMRVYRKSAERIRAAVERRAEELLEEEGRRPDDE